MELLGFVVLVTGATDYYAVKSNSKESYDTNCLHTSHKPPTKDNSETGPDTI